MGKKHFASVAAQARNYFLNGGGHRPEDYGYEHTKNMDLLTGYLHILANSNFYLDLNDQEVRESLDISKDNDTFRARIIARKIAGFTHIDLVALVIAHQVRMLLEYMVLNPLDHLRGKSAAVAKWDLNYITALPKLINFIVGTIGLNVVRGVTFLALDLAMKALTITLRVVSTVMSALALPINHLYNSRYQDSALVTAGVSATAATALWVGLATGTMTAAVLGSSAIAAALIAVAWPAAVAATAVAGTLLLGVGIYNLWQTKKSSGAWVPESGIKGEVRPADDECDLDGCGSMGEGVGKLGVSPR